MLGRHVLSFTVCAAVLVGVAGCSSPEPAASTPSAAVSATASASASDAVDPVILDATLRGQLGRVDPGLDADASVLDAKNVCSYVKSGSDEDALEHAVDVRFSGRAESKLTDAKLARIVAILKANYCPRV